MKKEALYENDLAQSWLGDIKKEFQEEQKRLMTAGVTIKMSSLWQIIHQKIWLSKTRRKEIERVSKK